MTASGADIPAISPASRRVHVPAVVRVIGPTTRRNDPRCILGLFHRSGRLNTSQPSIGAFIRPFRHSWSAATEVLYLMTSRHSGTFSSAPAANLLGGRVTAVDRWVSRSCRGSRWSQRRMARRGRASPGPQALESLRERTSVRPVADGHLRRGRPPPRSCRPSPRRPGAEHQHRAHADGRRDCIPAWRGPTETALTARRDGEAGAAGWLGVVTLGSQTWPTTSRGLQGLVVGARENAPVMGQWALVCPAARAYRRHRGGQGVVFTREGVLAEAAGERAHRFE